MAGPGCRSGHAPPVSIATWALAACNYIDYGPPISTDNDLYRQVLLKSCPYINVTRCWVLTQNVPKSISQPGSARTHWELEHSPRPSHNKGDCFLAGRGQIGGKGSEGTGWKEEDGRKGKEEGRRKDWPPIVGCRGSATVSAFIF